MATKPRREQGKAISVPPSQLFEGSDGSWSTFLINVGNPPQAFNILPSTSGQETWIPSREGCNSTDIKFCGEGRGALPFEKKPSGGFNTNASITWEDIGTFSLGAGRNLNYTGRGNFGFDTVGLGLPDSGPRIEGQVVGATASGDFLFGQLQLGPKPASFSNFNSPQDSLLTTLKSSGIIASLSFGYTAGAPYRLKKFLGSLTLGGYDSSLFNSNNVTFSFGPDDSRSLTVALQTITTSQSLKPSSSNRTSLLSSGIISLIDSSVPDIWLPVVACNRFQEAFGLQFDNRTQRYLVIETTHNALTRREPSITFQIADSPFAKGVNITLPYAAFDLQASFPIYRNTTRYFPLRRATNDRQYTLGRTFLQEAYIVADYERGRFRVAQTVFADNNPSTIVSIEPLLTQESTHPVNMVLIASIMAALVGVMLLTILLLWLLRSRRRMKLAELELSVVSKTSTRKTYTQGEENDMIIGRPLELMGASTRHELVGLGPRYEFSNRKVAIELPVHQHS